MTNVIEVHELTKRFGSVTALDGVSFDVAPGEVFGLVGPDGAGKTTLFRILTSLLLPDSGQATVLGCNVVTGHWTIRARVGYMPGSFSLYPDLSVAENLEFFAAVFGTTVKEGYELIAPVYRQLEPFRDRRADALSGGMKQKLALSCALVHRPELLFLDEPTTGVDAVSRREFWDQLAVLKSSGLPILVSTPYMDEALRCDRIALIHNGRLLGVDTPAAIGKRFTRPLVRITGKDRYGMLCALREHEHTASVNLFGDSLHYTDSRPDLSGDGIAHDVKSFLESRRFSDAHVEPIEPGIEDSFMSLMANEAA
ncbi:MAG TPA: ABC transporter ATP-binding protein [Gemmatimonadaceae bacterium]